MKNISYVLLNESKAKAYGNKVETAKIHAKMHANVIMSMPSYYRHIRRRHPDVTLDIIVDVLTDPDLIFRKSKYIKEFYYHKVIGGKEYRVIIAPFDKKYIRVITAYSVYADEHFFDTRKAYCTYEKDRDFIERDYPGYFNAFGGNALAYNA